MNSTMAWLTTSTILESLQHFEDESVWGLVVDHFRAPLVGLAMRMGLSAPDAEDLAQDSLLFFARSYNEGVYERDKGQLRNWLFGIARKKVLQRLTSSQTQRESKLSEVELGDQKAEAELERQWEEEWRWSVYQRALRQVEGEVHPTTFRIFELLVPEGRPVEEVCAMLHVTRTNVYNVRSRITRRIAELVEQYEE